MVAACALPFVQFDYFLTLCELEVANILFFLRFRCMDLGDTCFEKKAGSFCTYNFHFIAGFRLESPLHPRFVLEKTSD